MIKAEENEMLFLQYEAVVEYNVEEETKSYNVHRKTGDYIIGEVNQSKSNQTTQLAGLRWFNSITIISLYRTTFSPGWKDQHQQWTNSWGRLEVNVLGTMMLVKTNQGNCHSRYRRPTKGSFETQMCKYFTLIFQGVRYTAVEGMVRKRQRLKFGNSLS